MEAVHRFHIPSMDAEQQMVKKQSLSYFASYRFFRHRIPTANATFSALTKDEMVWRFDNRHDTKVWYWLKDKSKQTKESTQTYAYVHAHLCTGHEHTQVLGLLRSSLSSAKGCECPLIFHELVKYLQDQKLNYKGFKKKKWLSSVFCTQKYRLRIWSYFFFIYGPKKIRQFFSAKKL